MEYNKGLQIMLKELKLESSDINYSYFDIFGVMSDLIQDPQNYGTFYQIPIFNQVQSNNNYLARGVQKFHLDYWILWNVKEAHSN